MSRALIVAVFIAATATDARADDVPWATAVSAEQQDAANALFSDGNQLFTQLAHAPALEKYKAAVAIWDHPMIRFNMAVTLIRLDRVLDAADALDSALRYGALPFTPELYQQALDYQTLVKKQLAFIEATCDQPNTRILLDGKPWFVAPGSAKIRVMAGEHLVVAERAGHMTVSRPLLLAGGGTAKLDLELLPIESAVIVTYRHPRWLPWTVAGSGAALALGGLAFYLLGKSQMDEFAKTFVQQCPRGCESGLGMHPALADEQASAELKGTIAISMWIGGGAVAIAGVAWAIANRPLRSLPRVEVQPTTGGVAATAGWTF